MITDQSEIQGNPRLHASFSGDNAAMQQTISLWIEPKPDQTPSRDRTASLIPHFVHSNIRFITSRSLSSFVIAPVSDAKTARLFDRCSRFAHTVNEDDEGLHVAMGKLLGLAMTV